ncbi:restriction endonuclease subunit S [Puniceicoccales bacterium CK1056]|uniref:Restriction endonuclease subunit S n=1 Tax=Oceanipulchritudo coccoides TaxID=2706888 RepID=A0A6B2M4I0_9BACT|nr:restriction endonuclease subunit S [Oceanipulchritudo coccoides]NDV63139.1 restriction endonuclease subunit S [Oceanipulchritudo coccoides]
MATEVPIVEVGQVASSISETHSFNKEELIFLNTSDIHNGGLLHRNYSSVKDWPGQAKKSIRLDDILFSEIRPANGRWAYIDFEANDYVVSTKLMVIRANKEKVFPRYLYQFLTSTHTTNWLQHLAESRSGTFPQITFDQVSSLEIYLPPLPEQKAIAHILGTLDDKIELNRKMNETLEAMARALFKSWFVDFDPVRVKMDGRQPAGMDAETAKLFPSKFVESELGPIPEGWEVAPLFEIIEILSGGTPKTSVDEYWNGNIPWYSVKDSPQETDVWVINTEKNVSQLGIDNSAAKILPENTTIISARGTVGKLALVGVPMAMNQSCYGIRGVSGFDNIFIYFLIKEAIGDLQQRTHGTVFDTITRQTFDTLNATVMPAEITNVFGSAAGNFLNRIKSNLMESRTLANLRDTLLPKLLSGELSVTEAEEMAS